MISRRLPPICGALAVAGAAADGALLLSLLLVARDLEVLGLRAHHFLMLLAALKPLTAVTAAALARGGRAAAIGLLAAASLVAAVSAARPGVTTRARRPSTAGHRSSR